MQKKRCLTLGRFIMSRGGAKSYCDLRCFKGFTLIELAVVLVIVGVLSAGLFSGLSAQINTAKLLESRTQVERIKQSLAQFVQINQFAPCPDSDSDGLENRPANRQACSVSVGDVPFADLGLTEPQVKDSWGNKIRYAVNRQATESASICRTSRSASYFCNQQVPAFNRQTTPPIKGELGAGNYTVCSERAVNCLATTPSEHQLASAASIVLIAYNQDGQTALTSCHTTRGAVANNCNVDAFYHQAKVSLNSATYFDDHIVTISGYEIKNWVFDR